MKRIALITGASSGIGAAFARRLASQGYDLIITGRRKDKIEALAGELENTYGTAVELVIAELAAPEQVQELVQKIKATPELDVLVNNAGFGVLGDFAEGRIEEQVAMIDVHVLATVRLTHAALPAMLARGKGAVINVSSISAWTPLARNTLYGATKAFLTFFSEALHMELAGSGVRVQALCPGFTRTDFHARLGVEDAQRRDQGPIKWMSPEQVVDASLRGLERGTVVCVPGFWNQLIVGLLGFLPRRLYYRLAARANKPPWE
ncbi:MAG: SDR family oxidoreductase [Thermoflexales bacterium]|nr:SDR family oxidoreductase [Thermoflexales bacterium]